MRRVGQIRKRDSNEAQIVDALRRVGAHCLHLSDPGAPDLLVWYRKTLWLIEIKSAHGRATKAQTQRSGEGWPIQTVRSPQDALAMLGVRGLL